MLLAVMILVAVAVLVQSCWQKRKLRETSFSPDRAACWQQLSLGLRELAYKKFDLGVVACRPTFPSDDLPIEGARRRGWCFLRTLETGEEPREAGHVPRGVGTDSSRNPQ